AEASATAISLVRGLAAAHEVGVVHGDLKPANILLVPERGGVLTDFGIARALSEIDGGDAAIRGTPPYMPPEQLIGAPIDLRSDVSAAGVLPFEALTGKAPWPTGDLATLFDYKR